MFGYLCIFHSCYSLYSAVRQYLDSGIIPDLFALYSSTLDLKLNNE